MVATLLKFRQFK